MNRPTLLAAGGELMNRSEDFASMMRLPRRPQRELRCFIKVWMDCRSFAGFSDGLYRRRSHLSLELGREDLREKEGNRTKLAEGGKPICRQRPESRTALHDGSARSRSGRVLAAERTMLQHQSARSARVDAIKQMAFAMRTDTQVRHMVTRQIQGPLS